MRNFIAALLIGGSCFAQVAQDKRDKTLLFTAGTATDFTIVATKGGDGHWHLQPGMTIDDLMKSVDQAAKYQSDNCESDKRTIFAAWKKSIDEIQKSLKPAAKKVTANKKSRTEAR